jgi:hypothetical protein
MGSSRAHQNQNREKPFHSTCGSRAQTRIVAFLEGILPAAAKAPLNFLDAETGGNASWPEWFLCRNCVVWAAPNPVPGILGFPDGHQRTLR